MTGDLAVIPPQPLFPPLATPSLIYAIAMCCEAALSITVLYRAAVSGFYLSTNGGTKYVKRQPHC